MHGRHENANEVLLEGHGRVSSLLTNPLFYTLKDRFEEGLIQRVCACKDLEEQLEHEGSFRIVDRLVRFGGKEASFGHLSDHFDERFLGSKSFPSLFHEDIRRVEQISKVVLVLFEDAWEKLKEFPLIFRDPFVDCDKVFDYGDDVVFVGDLGWVLQSCEDWLQTVFENACEIRHEHFVGNAYANHIEGLLNENGSVTVHIRSVSFLEHPLNQRREETLNAISFQFESKFTNEILKKFKEVHVSCRKDQLL